METMQTNAGNGHRVAIRTAFIIAAGMILFGCAAPPAPNDRLRSVALVTSGDTVSFAFAGSVPAIVVSKSMAVLPISPTARFS